MQNQYGFILVIVLLFLVLFSWLTIAVLDSCNLSHKLAGLQQQHHQLFIEAENELLIAENQIISHHLNIPLETNLITDQQLRINQIPQAVKQSCELSNNFKNCYYIELIAQQQCFYQQTANLFIVDYYRISTITKKIESVMPQEVILQSTFVFIPNGLQYCALDKGEAQLIYSGRQSWREI